MARTGHGNNPYEWNFLKMDAQRQRQNRGIDRAEHRAPAGIGNDWKPRADDQPPLTERRAKEFAWAEQHLPGEHTGMVVSALIGMEVAGLERTRNSVLARLESQGRTMEQMKAKGWA